MNENNTKTGSYTNADGSSVSFTFTTSPSMCEKMQFVKSVSNTIIGDNYMSIARSMFFDFFIIHFFTDVDTSVFYNNKDVDGNELIDMIEKMLVETNIADIVKANMDYGVIAELNKAVDLDIEYRTGIHKNTIEESLNNLLNTLDRKVEGLDTEDMMHAMDMLISISDDFTPEKMIDAFANSDVFKQ